MSRRYFPLLLTSVALPLTLLVAGAAAVHAEIVLYPRVPGSWTTADGEEMGSCDTGAPGGAGGSATADAGFSPPNSDP